MKYLRNFSLANELDIMFVFAILVLGVLMIRDCQMSPQYEPIPQYEPAPAPAPGQWPNPSEDNPDGGTDVTGKDLNS